MLFEQQQFRATKIRKLLKQFAHMDNFFLLSTCSSHLLVVGTPKIMLILLMSYLIGKCRPHV